MKKGREEHTVEKEGEKGRIGVTSTPEQSSAATSERTLTAPCKTGIGRDSKAARLTTTVR